MKLVFNRTSSKLVSITLAIRVGVAGVYNKAAYTKEKITAFLCWSEYVVAAVENRETKVLAFPST
jgi:hypothetical protein